MSELNRTKQNAQRRSNRVRSRLSGTTKRPRLSIHISNRHVSAQIIDDTVRKTLAQVTTVGRKSTGTTMEQSEWVGAEIAKKAKVAKVKSVVFDRGDHLYHGRIKALADAARKEGLEF